MPGEQDDPGDKQNHDGQTSGGTRPVVPTPGGTEAERGLPDKGKDDGGQNSSLVKNEPGTG